MLWPFFLFTFSPIFAHFSLLQIFLHCLVGHNTKAVISVTIVVLFSTCSRVVRDYKYLGNYAQNIVFLYQSVSRCVKTATIFQ